VIAAAVVSWLDRHPGEVDEVRLVGFSRAAAGYFAAALAP
jgi:hypothetical protein